MNIVKYINPKGERVWVRVTRGEGIARTDRVMNKQGFARAGIRRGRPVAVRLERSLNFRAAPIVIASRARRRAT